MARFELFANPYAPERNHTPFVLDVQNDHLGPLATHVVIPLRTPKSMDKPIHALNPVLEFDGRSLVLDTAALAPVPASMLKHGTPLDAVWRDQVLDALDTLFGAY